MRRAQGIELKEAIQTRDERIAQRGKNDNRCVKLHSRVGTSIDYFTGLSPSIWLDAGHERVCVTFLVGPARRECLFIG